MNVFLSCLGRENINMSDKKAVIKNADMSDDMQQDAVDYAMQAMEKHNIEKDIAAYVKKVCVVFVLFFKSHFTVTCLSFNLCCAQSTAGI